MKKVETGGMKVGDLAKKIEMNEPEVEKFGRSVRFGQEECMKPEQDAMLAGDGEEDELIKCFNDITGEELPWQAVKEAHEKELKYLRELGVYEKVDERAAVEKNLNITSGDTTWVDTDTAFQGEPMQIRSRIVAGEFKSGDGPDLYAGRPQSYHLHCCESQSRVLTDACRCRRAYFHAKAQRLVPVK